MAYICEKPAGSCSTCQHYRKDVENDRMACWAQYDEKHKEENNMSTVTIEGQTLSIEQIQAALSANGIDIRDLAKTAKAINSGEYKSPERADKAQIGTTYELVMNKYPDFAIKRKTPKTETLLVIMPSVKGYYIKTIKNGVENAVQLTIDLYTKFTAGMPDIQITDSWIETISSGKKFGEKFLLALKNDSYIEMVKLKINKQFESLTFNHYNTCIVDNYISIYEKIPHLYIDLLNSERQSWFIADFGTNASVDLLYNMEKKFGLNNTRDFIKELELSLIETTGRYSYNPLNSQIPSRMINEYEFHYAEFKEYVLYRSVFFGYAKNMDSFWTSWSDSLKMQMDLYGKIKEKYPKNLCTYHQQLSYKYTLHKQVIDEQLFKEQSDKCLPWEMRIGDYVFIAPKTQDDMIEEAQQQCNCLASYVNRFINGECKIFFMRKANDIETSYVTIEVRDDAYINQIYYANNRHVSTEDRAVADKWLKKCLKLKEDDQNNDEES